MAARDAMNGDWQSQCSSNVVRARHLLENGLYTDCEFLVGGEYQKQVVRGHKVFLAMGSPVFEAMFFGEMASSQPDEPIEVCDISPETFNDLLKFIYLERVELIRPEQAAELCYAAKKYLVLSLVEQCTKYLWKDLGPNNAFQALEFAYMYDDSLLKSECTEIIRRHTQQALKAVEGVGEEAVLLVAAEDELTVSERELFDGVQCWARAQCQRRDEEPTPANMRQVLTNVLPHIRFLTMTSQEFAAGPAIGGLLHQEESFAILVNLNCADKWPMPANFSTSRVARSGSAAELFHTVSVFAQRGNQTLGVSHAGPKLYCYRDVWDVTPMTNMGVLDSSVTVAVDRNVCIHGVVIASQIPRDGAARGYTEVVYCHLMDCESVRLTHAHFKGVAEERSTTEVLFNRPVYVLRHREYRLCVVLNRHGVYPLGAASSGVAAHGVRFRFGPLFGDGPGEGVRDGFIRGLIFSL